MMLTFEPLPREYLAAQAQPPQDPPARLTDLRERWRVLERSDLAYRVRAALQREAAPADGRAVRESAGGALRGVGGGGRAGFSLRARRRGQRRAAAGGGRCRAGSRSSWCRRCAWTMCASARAACARRCAAADFRAARDLLGRAVFDARAGGRRARNSAAGWDFRPRTSACARRKLPFTGIYAVRVRGIETGNLAARRGGEPRVPAHGGWHRAAARGACVRFFRLAVRPRAGSGVRREDPRRGEVRRASTRWCSRCARMRSRRAGFWCMVS